MTNLFALNEADELILSHFKDDNYSPEKWYSMSIFSQKGTFHNNGRFSYFKSFDDTPVYLIDKCWPPILVDTDKRIIPYCHYTVGSESTIKKEIVERILPFLPFVDLINDERDIEMIGTKYVYVQQWFTSYGHMNDDLFISDTFLQENEQFNEYKRLHNYYLNNNQMESNIKWVDKHLYTSSLYLPSVYDKNIVKKMLDVVVINNNIYLKTFHEFHPRSVASILKSLPSIPFYPRIFLTRSDRTEAPGNNRLFSNVTEVENVLSTFDVKIINPEIIKISELIAFLQQVETLIITWGSTLINLCYLNAQNCKKIVILKSNSYKREPLHIFENLLRCHNLMSKIVVLETNMENDEINIGNLENFINDI